MFRTAIAALLLAIILALFSGCTNDSVSSDRKPDSPDPPLSTVSPDIPPPLEPASPDSSTDSPAVPYDTDETEGTEDKDNVAGKENTERVVAQPDSITVLVNKQFALPEDYEPEDLVYPDVPFTFDEKIDKRKMRKVAAGALEELFAGAKEDGIYLAGVSAYRSYATQKALFNRYVQKDGEAKARTYSAVPGTSEHETGLAIDVSGSDGKCAAEDCFADSVEAEWLNKHAAEYGFIIRYPKDKDSLTGYQYEPWHLRYVGMKVSKEIAEKDMTMEEYCDAIPVVK